MKVKALIAALEKLPKSYEVVVVLEDHDDPDAAAFSDFVYHVDADTEAKVVFICGVVEPPVEVCDACVARMNHEGPHQ
jgi:hypothetical protein